MVNKPKARGTAAESAIVKFAQANGFAGAMRPALSGAADKGDVWLEPGPTAIIESKNYREPANLGQPSAAQLDTWWTQTRVEAINAGAEVGLLVVKRKGTTDPGRWFAWVPMWLIVAADQPNHDAARYHSDLFATPVCTDLATALHLLRAAGYGDALEPGLLQRKERPVPLAVQSRQGSTRVETGA